MWRSSPTPAWCRVTMAPRSRRCGSAWWSSGPMTGIAETPWACSCSAASPWSARGSTRRAARRAPRVPRPVPPRSRGRIGVPADGRAQAAPRVVVHDRDRDPLVVARRRVHAVRRGRRVRVAERLRVDARSRGLEVHLADEVGGGLGLRELEPLALAARLPLAQRGEHADGEQPPGDVVGVVHRRAARIRRVGVVPQQVHAAEPGVQRAVGGHLAERSTAAVALRRDVDHARDCAPGSPRSRGRARRARRRAGSRRRRRPTRTARARARGPARW